MSGHLSEERLADVLDGGGGPEAREHAATCRACGARLEAARAALALVLQTEVPEPPALYWEALRRNVGRRIDEEGRRRANRSRLLVFATAAAVVLGVSIGRAPEEPAPAPALPAWSALPPADEDSGLAGLSVLAAETDLAAWNAGRGLGAFVAELSEEESQTLVEALRTDPAGEEL